MIINVDVTFLYTLILIYIDPGSAFVESRCDLIDKGEETFVPSKAGHRVIHRGYRITSFGNVFYLFSLDMTCIYDI